LAFYNRGAAYWNLGRTQLAIRDYSKAIETDAKVAYLQIASVYAKRSYAYFSIGELEKRKLI
jgi:tetratricopeptide (TPR) repeat protein